jgi:rhodanese-related sulfurtransferase
MNMIQEISPANALLKQQQGAVLIDVRELSELAIASVQGTLNIPMNSIPDRLDELRAVATNKPLLIMCHHGRRSLNVAHFLLEQGFSDLYNVTGGCDAWSLSLDHKIPRY